MCADCNYLTAAKTPIEEEREGVQEDERQRGRVGGIEKSDFTEKT